LTTGRPNILLITAHDLGTHLGCYGWDPALSTPHLDGLAAEGIRFDNHFCTAPYCSPSRGAIMTGKYPHVNGMMGLVNLGWDMPERNTVLPDALKECGYETVLFGLQHIAQDPSRFGYDHISERRNYGCKSVAPMVADYLRRHSHGTGCPFYAEVGAAEVHRAYAGLERLGASEDEVRPLPFLKDTRGLRMDLVMFYENIRRLDQAVGEILAAVESSGLRRNTLVVFTTDHGIAFPRAKATLYDAGIRTTLLMRWPDGVTGERTIPALVSNVDLFPTLLDVAGGTADDDCNGRSFLSLLRGESFQERTAVFAGANTCAHDVKRCVRTTRYKCIRNYNDGPQLKLPVDIEVTATRRDMGDGHLAPRPAVELYDLHSDPWEQQNLAGAEGHSEIESRMEAMLERLLQDTRDPVLRGPILRPEKEAGIVAGIRDHEAMQRRKAREVRIHEAYEQLRQGAG